VFFGAAGDSGLGPEYPSISPYVTSAGGTHINRDSGGNFTGTESCWTGSGGGISIYEPRPSYQNISKVKTIVGNFRGTPDMAADADPGSGVLVYVHGHFTIVGGTSVASPVLAGYVNSAGNFLTSTNAELTKTYILDSSKASGYWYPLPFFDITTGSTRATTGWDNCTGIGSPRKLSGF
jgi:kumamolisin